MWRSIKKTVKSVDIFGYPAYLNYDSKPAYSGSHTHNTLLGGLCSIYAAIMMLIFALRLISNRVVETKVKMAEPISIQSQFPIDLDQL